MTRYTCYIYYCELQFELLLIWLISSCIHGQLADILYFWSHVTCNVECNRTIHEEPETIRGMFALTDTRNCTHGSGRLSHAAAIYDVSQQSVHIKVCITSTQNVVVQKKSHYKKSEVSKSCLLCLTAYATLEALCFYLVCPIFCPSYAK